MTLLLSVEHTNLLLSTRMSYIRLKAQPNSSNITREWKKTKARCPEKITKFNQRSQRTTPPTCPLGWKVAPCDCSIILGHQSPPSEWQVTWLGRTLMPCPPSDVHSSPSNKKDSLLWWDERFRAAGDLMQRANRCVIRGDSEKPALRSAAGHDPGRFQGKCSCQFSTRKSRPKITGAYFKNCICFPAFLGSS